MAKRRAKIEKQGHPIIMEYEFDENHLDNESINVKIFDKPSKEWALFILSNRKSSSTTNQHSYDGVVFQLERYENNIITLDVLVEELSYQKLNKQYCFTTTKAVSKLIKL